MFTLISLNWPISHFRLWCTCHYKKINNNKKHVYFFYFVHDFLLSSLTNHFLFSLNHIHLPCRCTQRASSPIQLIVSKLHDFQLTVYQNTLLKFFIVVCIRASCRRWWIMGFYRKYIIYLSVTSKWPKHVTGLCCTRCKNARLCFNDTWLSRTR